MATFSRLDRTFMGLQSHRMKHEPAILTSTASITKSNTSLTSYSCKQGCSSNRTKDMGMDQGVYFDVRMKPTYRCMHAMDTAYRGLKANGSTRSRSPIRYLQESESTWLVQSCRWLLKKLQAKAFSSRCNRKSP